MTTNYVLKIITLIKIIINWILSAGREMKILGLLQTWRRGRLRQNEPHLFYLQLCKKSPKRLDAVNHAHRPDIFVLLLFLLEKILRATLHRWRIMSVPGVVFEA